MLASNACRACEAREKNLFLASLPSLAVCFQLRPDLLFHCSRVLEYAKIQTALQSISPLHACYAGYLLPVHCLWPFPRPLHDERCVPTGHQLKLMTRCSGMFAWNKITVPHSCSFDDAVREAFPLFSNVPEIKENQKNSLNLLLTPFLDCLQLP